MPTKQSRELYLLERFLPILLEGRSYTVSQPAPPLPDVVLEVEGRKIGIEITALIADEKVRQREATQDGILDQARVLFETKYQMPLHITVNFDESANWEKLNRKEIATYLFDAVESNVLKVKGLSPGKDHFDIRVEGLVHDHIRSVGIFYLNRLTSSCWSPITSFWVPDVSVETVQTIINRKSKNVNGYLTGCEEVWLIMLETGSPSSYFDRLENLQELVFTSGFSRTLIGRISKGEVIDLQTATA